MAYTFLSSLNISLCFLHFFGRILGKKYIFPDERCCNFTNAIAKLHHYSYLFFAAVSTFCGASTAISLAESEKFVENCQTLSYIFIIPATEHVSMLFFFHIVEILTVDDPLARFFYETMCIRCRWIVKELR